LKKDQKGKSLGSFNELFGKVKRHKRSKTVLQGKKGFKYRSGKTENASKGTTIWGGAAGGGKNIKEKKRLS